MQALGLMIALELFRRQYKGVTGTTTCNQGKAKDTAPLYRQLG